MSTLLTSTAAPDIPIAQRPAHHAVHIPGEAAVWIFILGDLLMFSAFFGYFFYARAGQVEVFTQAQRELSQAFGAANTLLLLTGSLFVVFGVHDVKRAAGAAGGRWFLLAFACAIAFGVDKVFEYGGKLRAGHTPFTNDFFLYYFFYTGIHCLHLLIGMGFLARMWQLSRQPRLTPQELRFIETGASYWHLVDLLWIVLFAILYIVH